MFNCVILDGKNIFVRFEFRYIENYKTHKTEYVCDLINVD